MPGMWELVIVAGIMFMLFGPKKIPELMRGMGQGITEFKRGVAYDPETDLLRKTSKLEDQLTP